MVERTMRTVVISGGGTGIGKAVTRWFADAGDRVMITGRRQHVLDRAASELGGDVVAACVDATDPAHVEAFAADLGQVDVLVNNAGGLAAAGEGPGLAALATSWRADLETNLLSAVLMTEALLPMLAPGGAVVSMGSIAADKGSGSYGAAKAALASWNVGLARRLGPRGVTANVVAPGYVAGTEFFGDAMSTARHETLVAATMTGRPGSPDDVAATVGFLASAGARQITGQVLGVNGGAWTTR